MEQMARALAMATRGKQGPKDHELYYLAGVIDSDGCIAISKMKAGQQRTKNPRYVLTMNVVNTSEKLMVWLVKRFGGRYKMRRRASEKHKATFDWFFNNGQALWLLNLLEKRLVVKGAQARVGIRFIEKWKTNQGMGARTSPREVARRERCYQQMKKLNQFGPVQPQRLSPLTPCTTGDAIV